MKQSWVNGLTEQEELDLRGNFVASKLTRSRLEDLLKQKITSSSTSTRSKKSYNSPNWAYEQADFIGYERALHEIINLLK